jgi:arginyl-tRNA--protein-N-Asp/Glu arginylyltransferase
LRNWLYVKVITEAKDKGFKYIYLGGANASKDMYKFQFKGLEWWDKDKWNVNLEELKEIIKNVEGVK